MKARRSPAGDLLTELVLKVFRLNGELLEAANHIAEGSGLTAARWQVLGAVLPAPLSVAHIARVMGLTRQSVQRLAQALVDDGLCAYQVNPAHRRAQLVAPTPKGWAAIERIRPVQSAWANQVAAKVGEEQLRRVHAGVDAILAALATGARSRERSDRRFPG
jgi:DNA-binding MarR family transcriptional regulator